MTSLTSPHILADLLITHKSEEDRLKKDSDFYHEQDNLELKKIRSGLVGHNIPRRTFNILTEYEIPKKVKENIKIALDFINEDYVRISEQMASGESSGDELVLLKVKQLELADKINLLKAKVADFNNVQIDVIKPRRLLPIALFSYEQYTRYIQNAEESFYFLSNKNSNPNLSFSSNLLDMQEYSKFELLYCSAKTPEDLASIFLTLTKNTIDNERFIFGYYESAIEGYYLHINDQALNISVEKLSKSKPEKLYFDEYWKCWILKSDSLASDFPDLLSLFDVWLDIGQVMIYTKDCLELNIEFDLSTTPITTNNTNYSYGILFDYTTTSIHIDENIILEDLQSLNLDGLIQNITYFDNSTFQKANNGVLWTFAELLLIKFDNASNPNDLVSFEEKQEYLAVYSTKLNKVLFYCLNVGFIADNCLILFINTINLLNINAFEQVNPYILLNI